MSSLPSRRLNDPGRGSTSWSIRPPAELSVVPELADDVDAAPTIDDEVA